MKRISIRKLDSPQKVKPRVFDIVVENDEHFIEIKQPNQPCMRVAFNDVLKQVEEACKNE